MFIFQYLKNKYPMDFFFEEEDQHLNHFCISKYFSKAKCFGISQWSRRDPVYNLIKKVSYSSTYQRTMNSN